MFSAPGGLEMVKRILVYIVKIFSRSVHDLFIQLAVPARYTIGVKIPLSAFDKSLSFD